MRYNKDSDQVCFSEKFEVKVYAIQESSTVRCYHCDIMQAFTLHDALVFSKKMKCCQPFDMSLQCNPLRFNLVGALHWYLKAKD